MKPSSGVFFPSKMLNEPLQLLITKDFSFVHHQMALLYSTLILLMSSALTAKFCRLDHLRSCSWSLTLLGLFGFDELCSHVGSHDVRGSQIANSEHQTQLIVSQRNDRVPGEHQCLCTLVWLRDLHKHTANLRKLESRRLLQGNNGI